MNNDDRNYFFTGLAIGMLGAFAVAIIFMWIRWTPLNAIDILSIQGKDTAEISILSADNLYGAIVDFYNSLLTYIAIFIAVVAFFGFFNLKSHVENTMRITVKKQLQDYMKNNEEDVVTNICASKHLLDHIQTVVENKYESLDDNQSVGNQDGSA